MEAVVLRQPPPHFIRFYPDNGILARVVIGRAPKDALSNRPLFQGVCIARKRGLDDESKKVAGALTGPECGKGLTFLGHYTWSKKLDDASIGSGNYSWLGGSTSQQNPLNRRLEKSLSAHDIPHRVVLSGAYQLPFGRGRAIAGGASRLVDAIVGGWEVSAFGIFQGGNPLQVSQNGGVMQNGGTQRPNLIGDPSTSGGVVTRLNNGYFNNAAFSQPISDVFGTAPRYLNYRGPGIKTVDAALLKSVATREGQRFEFRLEATNFTNTPIFSDPAAAFGSSNFGTITGLKVGARNVQLGFKYYF